MHRWHRGYFPLFFRSFVDEAKGEKLALQSLTNKYRQTALEFFIDFSFCPRAGIGLEFCDSPPRGPIFFLSFDRTIVGE